MLGTLGKDKILGNLKKDWEDLAKLDPLWAILSVPEKQFGKWDEAVFFKTAEDEMGHLLKRIEELDFDLKFDSALDFGCGVGRFTKILASHFEDCFGIDISPSMIAKAKAYHSKLKQCHFIENSKPDLSLFPRETFSFIYSNIVFQHIPERSLIFGYLEDCIRILKKDGLLVFQLPSLIPNHQIDGTKSTRFRRLRSLGFSATFLYEKRKMHPILMNFIPQEDVFVFLKEKGGRVLAIDRNEWAGPGVESRTYFVTKNQ